MATLEKTRLPETGQAAPKPLSTPGKEVTVASALAGRPIHLETFVVGVAVGVVVAIGIQHQRTGGNQLHVVGLTRLERHFVGLVRHLVQLAGQLVEGLVAG